MKIKILSPCFVAGKVYKKGDVADVDEKHAREVIGLRRAEKVPDKEPEPAQTDAAPAEGKKKRGGPTE